MPDTDPVKISSEVAAQLVQTMNEHKTASDALKAQFKSHGDALGELKEQCVKISADLTKQLADAKAATDSDVKKMLDAQEALQAQVARTAATGNAHSDRKTLGDLFVESKEFKSFDPANKFNNNQARAEFDQKNINTDPAAPNTTVPYFRIPGVVQKPNQQLLIRDILPTGQVSGNSVQYVKENVLTLNAGPQYSPGTSPAGIDNAKKNQSDITYTLTTVNVTTLAHFFKVSKQMLADTPFLSAEINGRLLYGLALKEESELLSGTGINGDILGLLPSSTFYASTYAKAGDTKIDKARHAMLQVAINKFLPSAHVMGVQDWHDIETTKDTFGRYLIGDPSGRVGQVLWGLPVVASLSMTNGQHLVGDFRQAAQIWDRMSYTVAVGYENDDFTRNMSTLLAEERLTLAVYQPTALIWNPAFV